MKPTLNIIFAAASEINSYINTHRLVITEEDIRNARSEYERVWLRNHYAYTNGYPGAVLLIRSSTHPGRLPHSDIDITCSDLYGPEVLLLKKLHT